MPQVRPGWVGVGIPTLWTPPRKKPSAKGQAGQGCGERDTVSFIFSWDAFEPSKCKWTEPVHGKF